MFGLSNRNAPLLAGMLVALTACNVDPSPGDEGLGTIEENLYVDMPHKWPSSFIPVCWESSGGDATAKAWVKDAVERSWQTVANVSLWGWGTCTSTSRGIRIGVENTSKAPHTTALGTAIDGVANGMVLNFDFTYWSTSCQTQREFCIRAIAVHEFGHALGFAHEQNRPDTPSWCDDEQGDDGTQTFGAWDADSIMNYCNNDWNNNGRLSAGDIRGIQLVYGRKPAGSIVTQHGYCADIPYASTTNGTLAQVTYCNAGSAQDMRYSLAGEFRVLGKCLDYNEGFAGLPVNLWDCLATPDQKLALEAIQVQGLYGKCLEVVGADETAYVQGCTTETAQQWTIAPTGEIKNGNGECLDVRGGVGAVGAVLQTYPCKGTNNANQRFSIRHGGEIRAIGDYCVQVQPDLRVVLATCDGGIDQKWNLAGTIKTGAGTCVATSSTSNGAALRVDTCTTGTSRQFAYYP